MLNINRLRADIARVKFKPAFVAVDVHDNLLVNKLEIDAAKTEVRRAINAWLYG